MIITGRLVLRNWTEEDAKNLYDAAKNSRVGKAAGWPPHTSVNYSRHIIKDYWNGTEDYAVILKFTEQAVGGARIIRNSAGWLTTADNEAEIEFWLAEPHWGQGIMNEVISALLLHCFNDLKLAKVWAGYFDDNMRAWKLLKKCGFQYQFTRKNVPVPITDNHRTEHVFCITREQWRFHRK